MLGAARLLAAQKDQWRGIVVFVAQPAEETLDGVKAMLADELFKKVPCPNFCLALHCIGDLATGEVGITSGPALASVQVLEITVRGKGGHGSRPHEAKDPIVLAAQDEHTTLTAPHSRDEPLQHDALAVTVEQLRR